MPTDDPLRILIVEDVSSDAELAERELRNDGILFTSKRVDTQEAFLHALKEFLPDLIISDYAMPEFDGMQALKLSLAYDPHLPFIIFTGSMNEETAVACMKAGATDYIIKEHITRLPLAVRGAFEQRKMRLEKEEVEEELRSSEERFKAIFNQGPLGIALIDSMTGHIHTANPMFAKIAGRTMEETANVDWMSITHPSDVREILDNIALLNAGAIERFWRQIRYLRSDGSIVWINMTIAPQTVEDKLYPFHLCMIEDITKHKQAEESLRLSEENFHRSLDDSPLGVRIVSDEGEILYANQALLDIFGYDTIEELRDTPVTKRYTESSYAEFQDRQEKRLLHADVSSDYEIDTVRKGGEVRQLQVWRKRVLWNGKEHYQVIYRDITDRKRAEEKLRESEKKYRELYDFLPIPVYEMDLEGNITSANRAIYETFGGTEEDLKAGFNAWQLLSPESIDKAGKNIQCLLQGEKIEGTEYTLKRINGSVFPAIVISSVIYNNGKPVGLRGAAIDITERKQQEEELYRTNMFLDSIVENIPDMIFLKDAKELRFVRVNRAQEDLMGYSRDNLHGKNDYDFFPKEQADFFTAKDREALGGKKLVDIPEQPLQTRNKGERILHTKKVPILNANGEPEYLMGISEDITDRKQAEKALKETLESLRKAVGVTIQVMVSAVEKRDPYTAGHQSRSANLARSIATEMGLPLEKIDGIRIAGSIHDIGKLSIPAEILSKPTKLSEIEFSLIKEHARQGFEILKDVESPWPLAEMVYQHHERMNGSGYPRNLKENDILMEARILAVADVVEAIASHRPYRPALGIDAAMEEISKNRGILYDPVVTDACLRLFQEKKYSLN